MKWIKASERLPDKHSKVCVRYKADGKMTYHNSDEWYTLENLDVEWLDESPSTEVGQQTDIQIAWELANTKDKPFFIDIVRALIRQYDDEDISLSKLVEELNLMAYKWAKSQPQDEPKPKVVCFCGSTRFAEWFMVKRWELEKQGIITLGINILPNNYFAEGNSHGAEQEGVKDVLDELHKRKIDLSDEVFILNVGGYIGESTRNELNYAIETGKPVKYLEPIHPH